MITIDISAVDLTMRIIQVLVLVWVVVLMIRSSRQSKQAEKLLDDMLQKIHGSDK